MERSDIEKRWDATAREFKQRSNYKDVWNSQAQDHGIAKLAVAGHLDEAGLAHTAEESIAHLRDTIGVHPLDLILEIGCGIGRVGKPLSRECLHWFGTDISGEMLKHAARRLRDCPNVTFVELSTVGLGEFYDSTLDVVYCTVVFMHLLEWDRYRYVQEAYRVLRPGGRIFVDNIPHDTKHGWQVFTESAAYTLDTRPAHISMTSSREELQTFLLKAGFEQVRIHDLSNGRIAATGHKPATIPAR
jgi:ubiquinone/menaquinone biosynthesis C-methylase UbiE